MGLISLHLTREQDAEEILQFELENRAFFDAAVGPRSEGYYDLDALSAILRVIERAQEEGERFMYLARNEAGELVGRINLYDIEYGDLQIAEIGYRIAQKHNGKGYATEAVRLTLHEAFHTHGLHRVEAHATLDNIGSQVVLLKNGFEMEGIAKGYIKVNGVWRDFYHFARLAPESGRGR